MTSLLVFPLLAVACFDKDKDNKKKDTGDTNTAPTSHPLVPDEYQGIWDWEAKGCDSGDAAVYHVGEAWSEATIDEDGDDVMLLHTVEHWYWFHGEEDFAGDCVDEWIFEGTATRYHWGAYDPCEGCEEEYWGEYVENTNVENGCNYGYDGIFAEKAGSENDYNPWVFKFDTITPSGTPNPDNVMLVYQAMVYDEYWYFDANYAKGTALPDTPEDYGGPSHYTWVNLATLCI
ncbi:MAG: hypothetical protein ABIO70_13035 [Pseudomonadota bacterium]